MIAPVAAHAQDASVLVVLAAPPLLLSPLVAAVIRRALWRGDSAASARSALVVAIAEFLLWLPIAWFLAVADFKEGSGAAVVGVLLIACVLALHRRFGPTPRSWPRSLASAGLFPLTWLLLQVLWYGAFVLLS